MKIAQVAPLFECVPPEKYGGCERIVSFLTEELVGQGHDVTLFASGDSITSALFVPCCPKALRLTPHCADPVAWHIMQTEMVARMADEFDVIHFHVDYLHFPVSSRIRTPSLTTIHGRLDGPQLPYLHRLFLAPVISISDSQREPIPDLNWRGTVYHGLPKTYLHRDFETPEYLLFLGRISPEKGVDAAIEIAIKAGRRLVVAAKVDPVDEEYFQMVIVPLLRHPLVTYVGEVNDQQKWGLMRKAIALLFPIDWPEPFGIVMVEAMANGVPVIAFRRGSVPEIIDHGKTGFIVNDINEAVEAVDAVNAIDRNQCCHVASTRFSFARMARDYLTQYQRLIDLNTNFSTDLQLAGA